MSRKSACCTAWNCKTYNFFLQHMLQNSSSSDLQSRYSEAQKVAALEKNTKNALGKSLVVAWITTIHRQTKYFGRLFAACVEKV